MQDSDTPEPEAKSASTKPPYRLGGNSGPLSASGCGVIAAVAVLLLIAGWGMMPGSAPALRPTEVLPLDTVLYIETGDLQELKEKLASSRLWKNPGDAAVAINSEMGIWLQRWLGDVQSLPTSGIENERGYAFALVAVGERQLAGLVARELQDSAAATAAAEAHLKNNRLPQLSRANANESADAPDKNGRYVFALENWIIATPSLSLKNFILNRPAGEPTLAELRGFDFNRRRDLASALIRVREYESRTSSQVIAELDRLVGSAGLPEKMADNARLSLILHRAERGFAITGEVLTDNGENAPPPAGGVWGWITTIVLIAVGIVVVPVLLLVAATLLLALYFYIRQWLAGELSPAEPPRKAEVSQNLKDDLALNPLEFSRAMKEDKTGGQAGEDDDENDEKPREE